MKIKVRTFIGILILLVVAAVLIYVIPNHLREIEEMRKAAQTPGMMYCLPQWVGGRAGTIYVVCGVSSITATVLILSAIFSKKA